MGVELKDLCVGCEVVMTDPNRPPQRVRITKMGRKYAHVGRDAFDLETGRINDAWGNSYLLTVSEHESRERRAAAERELSGWGVQFGYGSAARDKAEEIRDALRPILGEINGGKQR